MLGAKFLPDTWPNTGTLLRSPSRRQSGPEGLFFPRLLGSICANYLLPQLHNQGFVSSFPVGPYVKLGFAVQQAFLMNALESSRCCDSVSSLWGVRGFWGY